MTQHRYCHWTGPDQLHDCQRGILPIKRRLPVQTWHFDSWPVWMSVQQFQNPVQETHNQMFSPYTWLSPKLSNINVHWDILHNPIFQEALKHLAVITSSCHFPQVWDIFRMWYLGYWCHPLLFPGYWYWVRQLLIIAVRGSVKKGAHSFLTFSGMLIGNVDRVFFNWLRRW